MMALTIGFDDKLGSWHLEERSTQGQTIPPALEKITFKLKNNYFLSPSQLQFPPALNLAGNSNLNLAGNWSFFFFVEFRKLFLTFAVEISLLPVLDGAELTF
jgi:hypothetical protein